jgi:hypothetical protein
MLKTEKERLSSLQLVLIMTLLAEVQMEVALHFYHCFSLRTFTSPKSTLQEESLLESIKMESLGSGATNVRTITKSST